RGGGIRGAADDDRGHEEHRVRRVRDGRRAGRGQVCRRGEAALRTGRARAGECVVMPGARNEEGAGVDDAARGEVDRQRVALDVAARVDGDVGAAAEGQAVDGAARELDAGADDDGGGGARGGGVNV